MSLEKYIISSIQIKMPRAKVWDALVNPEYTKKYMFGCEALSDWKIGSTLNWKGSYQGKEMVFVTGKILEIEPNYKLTYTTFDPNNASIKDVPENHLHVTYQLNEANGYTLLTVTQGDYTTVADGEKRYQEAYNNGDGWGPILRDIKKLLET